MSGGPSHGAPPGPRCPCPLLLLHLLPNELQTRTSTHLYPIEKLMKTVVEGLRVVFSNSIQHSTSNFRLFLRNIQGGGEARARPRQSRRGIIAQDAPMDGDARGHLEHTELARWERSSRRPEKFRGTQVSTAIQNQSEQNESFIFFIPNPNETCKDPFFNYLDYSRQDSSNPYPNRIPISWRFKCRHGTNSRPFHSKSMRHESKPGFCCDLDLCRVPMQPVLPATDGMHID